MALSVLSRSVAGKVVVITGAASGMGRATAHLFADEGATVALIDINKVALDSVVKEIIDDGGQAKGWQLDLSCAADIAAVIDDIAVECGAMDILINNAGISIPTAIDGPDYLDIWNKSVAVLLTPHTHYSCSSAVSQKS
jgi:3-oxoacyl-[acyl-carrier protein] reductase